MNSLVEFQKEEYEELIKILGLSNDNLSELETSDDYFNAWNFGLQEEDCDYIITASL